MILSGRFFAIMKKKGKNIMVKKKRLSSEEKYNKNVKKYTSEHGGPDLTRSGDNKYKCIKCSCEVPFLALKCPNCDKDIDWNKYVIA